MSSEGSVTSSGSRIRQFGLYRTIDARTEEFLRSSRKRQIRQGCACAAISTAITVTVVVSVILVYEYSINSASNVNKKISLKPNWIGLMNDSDITSISAKFNKKINFDRTTLKLLPILLKALNKNRYLEKILEDYSSSSPPYVAKDSTEPTFTRNIFSDSKNWLKLPTSRHYTVEYKTSPWIYWKTPTQRMEYLTKIRKIRDYQRMLNYFDKMVNDKVGSYQKKEYDYTEKPVMSNTVPIKQRKMQKIQELRYPMEKIKMTKEFNNKNKAETVNCKCPKKLGQLLNKLIAGIQDMIPHMISNKLGKNLCANKTKPEESIEHLTTTGKEKETKPEINDFSDVIDMDSYNNVGGSTEAKSTSDAPKPTKTELLWNIYGSSTSSIDLSTSLSSTSSTTERTTLSTTASTITSSTSITSPSTTSPSTTSPIADPTTTSSKSTVIAGTSPNPTSSYNENKSFEDNAIPVLKKSFIERIIPPVIKETSTLMPNDQLYYDRNILDYDSINKHTNAPSTETIKMPEEIHGTTEMFVPIKFIDSSNEVSSTGKWFEAYTVDPTLPRVNLPLFKEDEYDDYFATTPKKSSNEIESVNVHNLELLKNEVLSSQYDKEYKTEKFLRKALVNLKPTNYHPIVKETDLDYSSMRKMADMIYLPQDKLGKEWKYTVEPHLTKQSRKRPEAKLPVYIAKVDYFESTHPAQTFDFSTSTTPISVITTNSPPGVNIVGGQHDPLTSENTGDDEFQDDYSSRQTETTIAPFMKYNITVEEKHPVSEHVTLANNEEKATSNAPKSMLPSMRPLYLEIQRNNEWRQDYSRHDYDINFNNNIFDLPNI